MDIQNFVGMVAHMGLYEICEKVCCKYLCRVCTLGLRQYGRKLLRCELQVILCQLYYLPSLMMFITENKVFQKVGLCEGCTLLLSF